MNKIIVFDDEDMILDLIVRFLEKAGYSVLPFRDVFQGLRYFRENHSSVDLVITDMTMPDMPGDELAAEIKQINSSVPVMLSTGYCGSLSDDSLPGAVDALLRKPFTGSELLASVSCLLSE